MLSLKLTNDEAELIWSFQIWVVGGVTTITRSRRPDSVSLPELQVGRFDRWKIDLLIKKIEFFRKFLIWYWEYFPPSLWSFTGGTVVGVSEELMPTFDDLLGDEVHKDEDDPKNSLFNYKNYIKFSFQD